MAQRVKRLALSVKSQKLLQGRLSIIPEERKMTKAACNNDGFIDIVIDYLDLLNRRGLIKDLDHIDSEIVICMTGALLDYFETLQQNDKD